jgi:hypothetical protein
LPSIYLQQLSPLPEEFDPGAFARTVNILRAAGKDRALASLRSYALTSIGADRNTKLLCRQVFVNPKGWDTPGLGLPWPKGEPAEYRRIHDFPIVFSEGIAFSLATGYSGAGWGLPAASTLDECQKFDIVRGDLKVPTRTEALSASRALLLSLDLKAIYPQAHDFSEIEWFVTQQALRQPKSVPPSNH